MQVKHKRLLANDLAHVKKRHAHQMPHRSGRGQLLRVYACFGNFAVAADQIDLAWLCIGGAQFAPAGAGLGQAVHGLGDGDFTGAAMTGESRTAQKNTERKASGGYQ